MFMNSVKKTSHNQLLIYGVIVASIFFVLFFFYTTRTPFFGYKTTFYSINGKKYHLLVADTPKKQEQGLMHVRKLENFDGMLFQLPRSGTQYFWNRNTFLNLQIYWINGESVMGITELPSIEKSEELVILSSPHSVDKVIEIVKKDIR